MKKKRTRLAKIAKCKNTFDKLTLSHHGMLASDYYSPEMVLARNFFELRHVDDSELLQRVKTEVSRGKLATVRTEAEWRQLKSSEKMLCLYEVDPIL